MYRLETNVAAVLDPSMWVEFDGLCPKRVQGTQHIVGVAMRRQFEKEA